MEETHRGKYTRAGRTLLTEGGYYQDRALVALQRLKERMDDDLGLPSEMCRNVCIELCGFILGLTPPSSRLAGVRGKTIELAQSFLARAQWAPGDYFSSLFDELPNGRRFCALEPCDSLPDLFLFDDETPLDFQMGTGRRLLSFSLCRSRDRLTLYGTEAELNRYRAALVNMKLNSRHPYFLLCVAPSDFEMPSAIGRWRFSNLWSPPQQWEEPHLLTGASSTGNRSTR